jgi:iron complex transport system ATP-binding protein
VIGTEVLVAASGLHIAYGERSVLRGVDLAVGRGEAVALLGPNASGKTTLLRIFAGTLRPAAGAVQFGGRPVADWRRAELARHVAVLPQSLELPAGFTVEQLVAMGRVPHATSLFASEVADVRAVERALVEADAASLAERTTAELSGGERQRVLVAMALAQEPDLILLDEPTLHLDLAHQVGVLETLLRLRAERRLALIAVLHDIGLAAAFFGRVAVLEAGRIAADGAPDDVLTPALIQRVFGVRVAEARTTAGRRGFVVGA